MAHETPTAPAAAPLSLENAPVTASEIAKESTEGAADVETAAGGAVASPADKESASDKPAEAPTVAESEKPAEAADAEMKDAEPASAPAEGTEEAQPEAAAATASGADETTTPAKSKDKSRRKSTGPSDGKKKLNKKGSIARILHLDAKPGDYYFVKLKGHPKWPCIIASDDMLPQAIIKTRPVSAKRPDGTYREDFAEGGRRVADRTYPVMYLETNEFGWVRNTDLVELDPKTVLDTKLDNMKKALQEAFKIAAEAHPLEWFKDLLQRFQDELLQKQQEEESKSEATPAKKSSKKSKAKVEDDDDDDLEMPDADEDEGSETGKKSNKRKAVDSAETPQRAESVKKPKIKLTTNSTPKTTNGTGSTPKSVKPQSEAKATKPKSKKATKETADKSEKAEVAAPKEPEYTAEEKHQRKEKEVLFLRHKLQRGLLTKEQGPKEEEMKTMSDYVGKLEAFPDLEVSIIRATKINKVLKAILKMDSIPKEDEYKFKSRSQVLLDKWTKLLAVDEKPSGETANGSSAEPTSKSKTNGVKEASEDVLEAAKDADKKDSEESAANAVAKSEKSDEKSEEQPATSGEAKEAEPVAASA